jgi:t-SNARE complex subunit (syntaxin)
VLFSTQVDGVKKDMDAIKKNITDIEKKHGEALKATSKAVSSKTEDSLHKLMDTVLSPLRVHL